MPSLIERLRVTTMFSYYQRNETDRAFPICCPKTPFARVSRNSKTARPHEAGANYILLNCVLSINRKTTATFI